MKKPAVGLFHNSSAESEAPGMKINSLFKELKNMKKPDSDFCDLIFGY